jgi:hypothetical protein
MLDKGPITFQFSRVGFFRRKVVSKVRVRRHAVGALSVLLEAHPLKMLDVFIEIRVTLVSFHILLSKCKNLLEAATLLYNFGRNSLASALRSVRAIVQIGPGIVCAQNIEGIMRPARR